MSAEAISVSPHILSITLKQHLALLRSCCWRRRYAWHPAWATRRHSTAHWMPWIAYATSKQRPAPRPTHRRRLGRPANRLAAARGRRRRRAQRQTSASPAAAGPTGQTAAPPPPQGPVAGTLRLRQRPPHPAATQTAVSQQVCRILSPCLTACTATKCSTGNCWHMSLSRCFSRLRPCS